MPEAKAKPGFYAKHVKRPLDFSVALVGIAVTSIPMAVIALCIKATSRGPAVFKQTRIGRNNKPFTIYKFRSMYQDAPHNVSPYEFYDANRYITPIGKVLRKTSLDELPQFFNILKGEMSLVGPRPAGINDKQRIALREESGAHRLRPGLTGLAQINGRDLITEARKAKLDADYSNRVTFIADLKCIAKTPMIVITRYGNVEGSESIPTKIPRTTETNK